MQTLHKSNGTRTMQALGVSALAAAMLLAGSLSLAGDRGAGARATQRPTAASRSRSDHVRRPERRDRQNDRAPAQAETVIDRTDTGMTRTTTVTNGQGETRTSTTTVTRGEGTRSVEVDRTGFDGRTSSVSRTTERTDDGFERTLEVTRPDGETMTREMSVGRDADGNRVVEGTHTGFDGETRTFTRESGEKKPDGSEEDKPETDGGG